MKRSLTLLGIPVLIAGILLLSAFGGDGNTEYPQGSPAGYTGSPGDGHDCVFCHGGSSSAENGWITSDIPPEGYIPGATYNLTVTVTGIGEKGFEVSPHNPAGQQLGTLISGQGNHLVGGTKYVTHSFSTGSNPATWSFQWKAPSAGAGTVTFYGAFTVTKPVTKTSTLVAPENPMPITTVTTANPPQIHSGDSTHLNVDASGGTGIYSYQWTSDPPGFFSGLKSPWAKPAESATFYVEVTDGVSTVTDSVDVTVFGVGIWQDQTSPVSLSLFPNPVERVLTVTLGTPGNGIVKLSLTDIQGRLVWQQQLPAQPRKQTVHVDMTSLCGGIYLLHVNCGSSSRVEKVFRAQ